MTNNNYVAYYRVSTERQGQSGLGQGIADALNARGIRTARGRRWYATTVKNVLDRAGVEGVEEAA